MSSLACLYTISPIGCAAGKFTHLGSARQMFTGPMTCGVDATLPPPPLPLGLNIILKKLFFCCSQIYRSVSVGRTNTHCQTTMCVSVCRLHCVTWRTSTREQKPTTKRRVPMFQFDTSLFNFSGLVVAHRWWSNTHSPKSITSTTQYRQKHNFSREATREVVCVCGDVSCAKICIMLFGFLICIKIGDYISMIWYVCECTVKILTAEPSKISWHVFALQWFGSLKLEGTLGNRLNLRSFTFF